MPCVAGRAAGREQLLPPQPPPLLLSLPKSKILDAAGSRWWQMLCAPDIALGVSKGAKGNVVLARLVLGVGSGCNVGEGYRFACSSWGHSTSASHPCTEPGSVLLEQPGREKLSAAPHWHKVGKSWCVAGTGGGGEG